MNEHNKLQAEIARHQAAILEHKSHLDDLRNKLETLLRDENSSKIQSAKEALRKKILSKMKPFLAQIDVPYEDFRCQINCSYNQANRLVIKISYDLFAIDSFIYHLKIYGQEDSSSVDFKFEVHNLDETIHSEYDMEFLFEENNGTFFESSLVYCELRILTNSLTKGWKKFGEDLKDLITERLDYAELEGRYLTAFMSDNLTTVFSVNKDDENNPWWITNEEAHRSE